MNRGTNIYNRVNVVHIDILGQIHYNVFFLSEHMCIIWSVYWRQPFDFKSLVTNTKVFQSMTISDLTNYFMSIISL